MSASFAATVKIEGPRLIRTFVQRMRSAWMRFSDSRALVYVSFAIVYLIPNLALARWKLIWQDEFYTLYLSTTRSWHALWSALSTGADQNPPSFFYITHLVFRAAGAGPITLRIPALAGFGLCCICLYEIVRLIMGRQWAVVAILLPLGTPALYYATEARGYGLELGFATFSLLMWMLASDGKRRTWTLPGLAVGLCLGVASHYYAVLFVIPLAAAEFVRTIRRHSIDIAIWCAMAGAAVPLCLFAPLLLKARTYSSHFWALPRWGEMVEWYPGMLGLAPFALIAASGLVLVFQIRTDQDPPAKDHKVPHFAVVAVAACALLPVIGMLFACMFTHAYTPRYFIGAVPGTLIFLLWGLRRILRNDGAGPALASLLCLAAAGVQWYSLRAHQAGELFALRSDVAALRRFPEEPVVVNNGDPFYRLSFYAPRDLAARLIFLADPHLSEHYVGQDTVDSELLEFAPWFPLHVAWWSDWWRSHSSALVFGGVDASWVWLTYALPAVGPVQVVDRNGVNLLLSVKRKHVPVSDRVPGDPSGEPQLFRKMPQTGPSLCNLYMPGVCPVLEAP